MRPRGRLARGPQALLAIAIIALLIGLQRTREPAPSPPAEHPGAPTTGARSALVAHVDDGDTITLADGAQVRYLGIDTPEAREPLANEAREENRRIVGGKQVEVRQGGPEAADRYGRLLALVYAQPALEGGEKVLVNAALLRSGLAWIYLSGPNAVDPSFLPLFLEAQRQAIDGRKGVWGLWLGVGGPAGKVLVTTRHRIHRADCEEVRGKATRPVVSLEGELRAGKSFCRSCRPQAR